MWSLLQTDRACTEITQQADLRILIKTGGTSECGDPRREQENLREVTRTSRPDYRFQQGEHEYTHL